MRIEYDHLIRTIIERLANSNKSKLLSSQSASSARNGHEKLLRLFRVPVAVGVLGLPAPAVLAHAGHVVFGRPAQLVAGLRGVGVALRDIAGAPGHDAVGNLVTARSLEGVNHVEYR